MADNVKHNVSYHMGNCIPQETTIKDVRLARAYVPFQKMCSIFSPIEALKRGTIFPELYSPYESKEKKYKSPDKNR
ncbi:MAG: spore coat associated protein CotJA [Clostridiales bacterium]|nr:spore coat associated protein CotJA [Clostridiales bacterium]